MIALRAGLVEISSILDQARTISRNASTSTAGPFAATASDDNHVALGNGNGNPADNTNRLLFNVIDGADSTFGNLCTNTVCIQTIGANSTGYGTMWSFGTCWDVEYNVFRHVSNGQCGDAFLVHDNLFEYFFNPGFGGRHGNVWEIAPSGSGNLCTNLLAYNNLMRNTVEGVLWWPQCPNYYIFNNVWENSGHFTPDPNGMLLSPPGSSGSSVVAAYVYNNTFDSTIAFGGGPSNASTPSWASGSVAYGQNNQILQGCTTWATCFGTGSGNTITKTDNGGEVYTGVGYSLATDFYPPNGTASTVGHGNNLTSTFCSTVNGLNAAAGTACLSGTSKGVSEVSAWGGQMASYPAITVNPRPSSGAWDAGAYEFSAGAASAPSCSPGSGTYSSTQTITCTNPNSGTTVMCYAFNGISPATNGAGTACLLGLAYTLPFTVPISETLHVIAGTSTLPDSSIVTYNYTITTTLTVTLIGNNIGSSVTSSPAGINCPTTCSASFNSGTVVTLTENPASPYFAYGFSAPTCPATTNLGAPCTFTITASTSVTANFNHITLPQNWVANTEYLFRTSNLDIFPAGFSCNSGTFYPTTGEANSTGATPNAYLNTQAGLNQLVLDMATCRFNTNTGTTGIVPAGTLYSAANGITLPQIYVGGVSDTSTNFIVLSSSSPLPAGRTVCSHGIQDNVASSTQPGIRNLGCSGANMSYQLGATVTPITPGAFTLANGTPTNTATYNDIASMYTIECTAGACSGVTTAPPDANGISPHHFAILNAEVRPVAGLAGPSSLISIGPNISSTSAISQLPNHIHIAYSYLHGDWTDAPVSGGVATSYPTGANSIPNDLSFQGCFYCSFMYSYIDQSLRPGAEGHGIQLTLADQIKIAHNWMEGNSSGSFCWGDSFAILIPGFIPCTDIDNRANRYTYPFSWNLAYGAGFKPNGGSNSFVRKNCNESKSAERYLFDGNICEHSDGSGGQNGELVSFKTTNYSSGSFSTSNFWLVNEHVTVTNNITRSGCQGNAWGFRSVLNPSSGGGVTLPTQLAIYNNNLMYDIDVASHSWCTGVSPLTGFRLSNNFHDSWTGTARRDATGTIATLTLVSQSGGTQSDVRVADPVAVFGCTGDTNFNTMTNPPTATTLGPPAISPTDPTTLVITYANTGTPNATDSTCSFGNNQGWPNYLFHSHNTNVLAYITNSGDPDSSALAGTGLPFLLSRNMSFTNDIFVGGSIASTFAEGTATQTKAMDSSTETFNHTIITGRTASLYTEYPGAISPPTTIYFPTNGYCAGNDPTAGNCPGMIGAMSAGAVPINLSDWHQYRLCHVGDAACNSLASLYAAGQANQATDGTDLGVNTAAIDAAQTSILYVCATFCGTGPFIDAISSVPAPYIPGFLGFNKPLDIFKGDRK